MSAIVQAYNRSPSGNCNATDDWKKKKKQNMKLTLIYAYCGWRWHHIFSFFSWQHLKAKVCIQDQMTEGLKLIMISIACIDKEYCISTSPFLLYSWKMPLCCSIMVSALDSGWRGLGLRPSTGLAWSFCCVLWQTTLFSQCLSLPRSMNRYRPIVREVR